MESVGIRLFNSVRTTINGGNFTGLSVGIEVINSPDTRVVDTTLSDVVTAVRGRGADRLIVLNTIHHPFRAETNSLSASVRRAIYGNV